MIVVLLLVTSLVAGAPPPLIDGEQSPPRTPEAGMVLPGVDPAANMKAAEQLAEALDTGETNASVVGGDAIMVTICPSGPGENAGDNGYGPRWNAELPESVTQWTSLVRKHFCTDWGVSDALTIIACETWATRTPTTGRQALRASSRFTQAGSTLRRSPGRTHTTPTPT